jgi:hypothetical protein
VPQTDTSWWERLIAGLAGKQQVPPLPPPTPPKVDERAWARNVEMARISSYLGTVHDLGLIVFGETQSYSDRPDSNESIGAARQKLAHSILNADAKWDLSGSNTPRLMGRLSHLNRRCAILPFALLMSLRCMLPAKPF